MSVEIFQSPEWFAHLWENGFEKQPHRCWCWNIETPGNSQGMCIPLVQELPDSGLSSLSNYYSGLFGPEIRKNFGFSTDKIQWFEAINSLRTLPGSHIVRLQPLDADNKCWVALEKNLVQNGFWTRKFFCFGNWYQKVPTEGFEKYWAERPSALVNTVRRGKRRLDAAGQWHIDMHTGSCASESLERAIKAYEEVYARSWKQPEPCTQFMPGLMHLAAEKGWLRLGILWLKNEPVAAQFWLTTAEKANIYKLAYAKGFEKFSVGSILTAAMMQHAMDIDRVSEVDYLTGDDGYKVDWMEKRRQRTGLFAIDLKKKEGWLAALEILSSMGWNFVKRRLLKI